MKTLFSVYCLCTLLCLNTHRSQAQVIHTITNGISVSTLGPEQKVKILDTALFEVTYQVKIKTTEEKEPQEDLWRLSIGTHMAKTYSYKNYIADSMIQNLDRSAPINTESLSQIKYGAKHMVFQDYPKQQITYTDKVGADEFEYKESLHAQKWLIGTEQKQILAYTCTKASCEFRGRQYTAWFTTEIPVQYGPWKFYGLPGLILALADDQGVLSMEAIGLSQQKVPISIPERQRIKTTRVKLAKLQKKFAVDPLSYLNANGFKVTMRQSNGSPMNPKLLATEPIFLEIK